MEQIPGILLFLSRFSVLIPFLFLLRANPAFTGKILRGISVLLAIAAVSDLICYVMLKKGLSNIAVINSYFIIQFYVLSYIYSLYLKNKTVLIIALVTYTGFTIFNTVFIQSFSEMQSWSDGLQSLLFIALSISCHLQLHKNPPADERLSSLILWFNLGVLFYFSLNLYLFMVSNYIFNNESVENSIISWSFHNLFNIVKNVLFAIGIYYAGMKESKS